MTLHIDITGSGPDLVLLHGWGFSSSIWQPIVDNLRASFTLHLVDLPGHGRSDTLDLPTDIERAADLIAQHTPPRAHYLGWSLGGLIAQALALTAPQRIAKLVLVASTPCFINNDHWQAGMPEQVFRDFAADLTQNYSATIKRFLTLQALGNPAARGTIKGLIEQFAHGSVPNANALAAGLHLLRETDLRQQCTVIHQPCLLIHSDNDKLVPLEAGVYLQQQLPHARLCHVSAAGHIPFIVQADSFCQQVTSFLYD